MFIFISLHLRNNKKINLFIRNWNKNWSSRSLLISRLNYIWKNKHPPPHHLSICKPQHYGGAMACLFTLTLGSGTAHPKAGPLPEATPNEPWTQKVTIASWSGDDKDLNDPTESSSKQQELTHHQNLTYILSNVGQVHHINLWPASACWAPVDVSCVVLLRSSRLTSHLTLFGSPCLQ